MALGVQQAILARTMPVVRHDLAGMLTIMRMGAVVLKRRAGDPAGGGEPITVQIEQFEEHLASLAESARRLRHWDLQGPQAPEPLAATAQLARDLSYPLLAMRGLQLELSAAVPQERAPQQPVLCLLLGAIHMLAEAPGGAPAAVHIQPLNGGSTSLRVQAQGSAPDAPPAAPTPGMPALDGAALSHLAQYLGAGLRHGRDWVEIDPPHVAQKAQPTARAQPMS